MFRDLDHTAAVIQRLRAMDGDRAVAGIFSPGKEHEAEKLGYQEFGTHEIPQRQTAAPSFDQNEDALVRQVADDMSDAVEGDLRPARVAEHAAETMAKNLVDRIESNVPPALAPSTLAARRARGNTSTDTLVDRGDMRDAIEHTVWESEGGGG